jgi:Tfp pilus assembly ATPase PilU
MTAIIPLFCLQALLQNSANEATLKILNFIPKNNLKDCF